MIIRLTHAEAAGLSAAAVWADGKHRHPALQSARLKLREALNGKQQPQEREQTNELDPGERYVKLEC